MKLLIEQLFAISPQWAGETAKIKEYQQSSLEDIQEARNYVVSDSTATRPQLYHEVHLETEAEAIRTGRLDAVQTEILKQHMGAHELALTLRLFDNPELVQEKSAGKAENIDLEKVLRKFKEFKNKGFTDAQAAMAAMAEVESMLRKSKKEGT